MHPAEPSPSAAPAQEPGAPPPRREPKGATTTVKVLRATLLILLAGIGYLIAVNPGPGEETLQPVPEFSLETLDGGTLKAGDLLHKITVLNFFATWCGPCRAEMPELVNFAHAHQDDDVAVVGVSAGFDEPAALAPFVRSFRMPYPVLLQGEGLLSDLGRSTLPTTVMVDPQGRVAMVWEGALNEAVLERALARIRAR